MENLSTAKRLDSIHTRIADACNQAGRSLDEVKLVAVSKRIDPLLMLEACRAGQWDLGENRIPDALDRQGDFEALLEGHGLPTDQLRWHFIGHLQSRKAASASGRFCLLHGVDSLKLARKLDALAQNQGRKESILLEVNAGREAQKNGLDPDQAVEVAAELADLPGLDLQGMMTMAPYGAPEKILRETFARLRNLNEEARRQTGLDLPHLSMGMSGDFEAAIMEGSTLIRVGGAIFGPRTL
jgi:PLP dependent protein